MTWIKSTWIKSMDQKRIPAAMRPQTPISAVRCGWIESSASDAAGQLEGRPPERARRRRDRFAGIDDDDGAGAPPHRQIGFAVARVNEAAGEQLRQRLRLGRTFEIWLPSDAITRSKMRRRAAIGSASNASAAVASTTERPAAFSRNSSASTS